MPLYVLPTERVFVKGRTSCEEEEEDLFVIYRYKQDITTVIHRPVLQHILIASLRSLALFVGTNWMALYVSM